MRNSMSANTPRASKCQTSSSRRSSSTALRSIPRGTTPFNPALVHDLLGHERCAACGGDIGGAVIQDLGLRFEGFVGRQCIFNAVLPIIPEAYERAGISSEVSREVRMAGDYFRRQGREADALA